MPRCWIMKRSVRIVALAVALIATACSPELTVSPEPTMISDAEIATATEIGTQRADYFEGVRAEERLMSECMAERGYEYTPLPAEDLLVFKPDLPGYGMTQSLLDGVRGIGDEPPDPNISRLPKGERDGYIRAATACRDRVSNAIGGLLGIPAVVDARRLFDAAWGEFYGTSAYVAAVKDWSACMAERGFEFSELREAKRSIIDRLVALASSVDDVTLLDEGVVRSVLREELAVSDADRACRALHIDQLELDFKTRLFRSNPEAVAVLRSATRGESN